MERAIDKLEPFQRAICKAHLAAAGISVDALEKKPLIAIANSWNEVCPGHEPLRQLAQEVKKGILEAGGEPIEFNTIAMCDGIAQGHSGMRYCLPHREIITDSIEAMVVGEGVFDGVVFMGSCDKIIPGMLNAAARINLPAVMVTAGPCFPTIRPSESKELRQQFLRDEITERELIEGTLKYYTGPGICPFLGTANTMGGMCEALGMMLPGSSLTPSPTSIRRFQARQAGKTVVKLVETQITPAQIMTKEALLNAVILLSSIGGSLNAMIHLPSLAEELGLSLTWEEIAEITSKTPVLCGIVPNGDETVVDLHYAGGIPAVMKELKEILYTDAININGNKWKEILQQVPKGDSQIIHSIDNPLVQADGIQVLYGNLAPEGALVKTSAVPENVRVFEGVAKVFECEDDCYVAFREKKIESGDVVIVRYEGPRGGPGMKELHRITEIIKSIPQTAVITDGRFSGASGGLSIGYLCPEAADGGTIALIQDGDRILIDLKKETINVDITKKELEERRKNWKPEECLRERGYLGRYKKQVNSAKRGATLCV